MIITIPGQTRAKKNSTRILGRGTKKWIGASAIFMEWQKQALQYFKKNPHPPWTGGYPVEILFFFFRDSKRKWDISNMYEGTQDILQKVGIIEDDSMNHVIPVFAGWAIDKQNPRVVLKLQPATKQYFRED